MQLLLLSGGSGKRLWPLSNDSRSKQFLRLLPTPDGNRESMVQRVVRQIKESTLSCPITIATSASQHDIITNQLGNDITVITEPSRRDTFPAICLASVYLEKEAGCDSDEIVAVMPCDPYTEDSYFRTIANMAKAVQNQKADLVLMGIKPTYPSTKYGYVIPRHPESSGEIYPVERFTEKPNAAMAEKLITESAFWNGGVFVFRLGYMTDIVKKHLCYDTFESVRLRYDQLPKISFDYEVVEKADSVAVIPYDGKWNDLGTWNTLADELKMYSIGNVMLDEKSVDTNVINELDIPVLCIGTENLVVTASYDGILVADKDKSEDIKHYTDKIHHRPMYEERRWGEYKVVHHADFADGHKVLTKQMVVKTGKNICYQKHRYRDEVWTFIGGEGLLVIDEKMRKVAQGDVIHICKGTKHAVKAETDLYFIEVQIGTELSEDDTEHFAWEWPD